MKLTAIIFGWEPSERKRDWKIYVLLSDELQASQTRLSFFLLELFCIKIDSNAGWALKKLHQIVLPTEFFFSFFRVCVWRCNIEHNWASRFGGVDLKHGRFNDCAHNSMWVEWPSLRIIRSTCFSCKTIKLKFSLEFSMKAHGTRNHCYKFGTKIMLHMRSTSNLWLLFVCCCYCYCCSCKCLCV